MKCQCDAVEQGGPCQGQAASRAVAASHPSVAACLSHFPPSLTCFSCVFSVVSHPFSLHLPLFSHALLPPPKKKL